ncbi:MAG: OB-fold putative lipoprotein [Prevotellaceae bacterium]|nr:OB-fold putative lipoprotein [Prevotellaceae bacterium]
MKSKKFLHLVSGAVVLAFVFFAVASSDDKSTEKEISETDLASAIHISASTLYEDYDANEISADQKYKGKVLVITGRIESIGKDITDNIYVALEGDGFINVVQCMFSDDHVSETSELRKGQSVKIKGRCSGQTLGSIIVRGCSLQ